MKIPSETEWGDWRTDVDQRYAHDLYISKSNEEMRDRFLYRPNEVFSELRFVARIPFQYYVMGFSAFKGSCLLSKIADINRR
jgi:hypothetical protein